MFFALDSETSKQDSLGTKDRWVRAAKESAFDLFRSHVILETKAEHLLACLKAGTVSTNILPAEAAQFLSGGELVALSNNAAEHAPPRQRQKNPDYCRKN